MDDRIMTAAQAWADAREDGTHTDAMRALNVLQRTIADEIAAVLAAKRERCREAVTRACDEALANYPPFVCPTHGLKRFSEVRWIEGAHRCDECGEACNAVAYGMD